MGLLGSERVACPLCVTTVLTTIMVLASTVKLHGMPRTVYLYARFERLVWSAWTFEGLKVGIPLPEQGLDWISS